MSELKLERRLRREVDGVSSKRSRIGGTFSLFALLSNSSIVLRERFAVGVASGVSMSTVLFETTDDEREREVRLPRTLVAVWERVRRRVGVVDAGAMGVLAGVVVAVGVAAACVVGVDEDDEEGCGRCGREAEEGLRAGLVLWPLRAKQNNTRKILRTHSN